MGQRLVVSVDKGDDCIVKIYSHWDAYTMNALRVMKDLLVYIEDSQDLDEFCDKCIESGYSIATSEERMAEFDDWAEGVMDINLDTRKINNRVAYRYESIDDYIRCTFSEEELDELTQLFSQTVPQVSIDVMEFQADQLEDLINELYNANSDIVRYGNEFIELIN